MDLILLTTITILFYWLNKNLFFVNSTLIMYILVVLLFVQIYYLIIKM